MLVQRESCIACMMLTSAAAHAVTTTAMDGKSAIRFVCPLRSHLLLGDEYGGKCMVEEKKGKWVCPEAGLGKSPSRLNIGHLKPN